jgi:inosine-uridine nucleoside N-ribohydrolase
MNLIIQTDIGNDPDDLFAIAYLIAAGVHVRAVVISPGDPHQVAICRLLLDRAGVSAPIGVGKLDRTGHDASGIHRQLLRRHGRSEQCDHDGDGADIIANIVRDDPSVELFVIGPVMSVGRFLKSNPTATFTRATMQGGFLAYHQHSFNCPRIDKFEGADWQDTFNLNGDRKGADHFLKAAIADRRMVGKNVCHTVWFTDERLGQLRPQSAAAEFFVEAAELLLDANDAKKFHDPTAAVCHLHPEVGSWVRGRTVRKDRGWGTELADDADHILAAVEYEKLWECLTTFR